MTLHRLSVLLQTLYFPILFLCFVYYKYIFIYMYIFEFKGMLYLQIKGSVVSFYSFVPLGIDGGWAFRASWPQVGVPLEKIRNMTACLWMRLNLFSFKSGVLTLVVFNLISVDTLGKISSHRNYFFGLNIF